VPDEVQTSAEYDAVAAPAMPQQVDSFREQGPVQLDQVD
jgi:hypothetical protein